MRWKIQHGGSRDFFSELWTALVSNTDGKQRNETSKYILEPRGGYESKRPVQLKAFYYIQRGKHEVEETIQGARIPCD